jgi:hypothetical protein
MVDVSGFFTLLVSKNLLPLDLYLSLSHTLSLSVCFSRSIIRSGWNYGKALGAPTGPATLSHPGSATWIRHFGKGVQARYDLATSKGKVIYA